MVDPILTEGKKRKKVGEAKLSEDPRERTKKPSTNGWQWGCNVCEGEAKGVENTQGMEVPWWVVGARGRAGRAMC